MDELPERKLDDFPKKFFDFDREIESVYNDWINYNRQEV